MRGGAREGAGRPTGPTDKPKRKMGQITLLPHEWDQLDDIGPSRGKAVSKLLADSHNAGCISFIIGSEYFLKKDQPIVNTDRTLLAGTKCKLVKYEKGNDLVIVRIDSKFDIWIEADNLVER